MQRTAPLPELPLFQEINFQACWFQSDVNPFHVKHCGLNFKNKDVVCVSDMLRDWLACIFILGYSDKLYNRTAAHIEQAEVCYSPNTFCLTRHVRYVCHSQAFSLTIKLYKRFLSLLFVSNISANVTHHRLLLQNSVTSSTNTSLNSRHSRHV